MFENKKILFLGPSRDSLNGFDFNEINKWDLIVRTNKFLETEDNKNGINNKCDLLFINSNCVKFYANSSHKLEGKRIFVKLKAEKNYLQSKNNKLNITDIEPEWRSMCRVFYPHVPYYGTAIIEYLKSRCGILDVAGIDFYKSGFPNKEMYLKGYYNLANLEKEDPIHSIEKDLKYMKNMLNNNKNVRLIHKTRQIFEEII